MHRGRGEFGSGDTSIYILFVLNHADRGRHVTYPCQIPHATTGVDILFHLLENLRPTLCPAHKRATHEVEFGRIVLKVRHAIQKSAYTMSVVASLSLAA